MQQDLCWAAPLGTSTQLITRLQGLIWTAGVMYNLLHYFNIPIHVQEVRHAARRCNFRSGLKVLSLLCCSCQRRCPLWQAQEAK